MTNPLSITIEFQQLLAAEQGLTAAAQQLVQTKLLLDAAGRVLLQSMQRAAPVGQDQVSWSGALLHRGGTLQRSLTYRRGAGVPAEREGAGIYGVAYADFVVGGTGPHRILPVQRGFPRSGKALWWQGSAHPVRAVNHPGTAPNDFPRRAVAQAQPALEVLMLENGRKLISLIARR